MKGVQAQLAVEASKGRTSVLSSKTTRKCPNAKQRSSKRLFNNSWLGGEKDFAEHIPLGEKKGS